MFSQCGIKLCLQVAFACGSASTFASMVMQMHMQRMGLNPFSVFAIATMLKLTQTLTQTLRVNRALIVNKSMSGNNCF